MLLENFTTVIEVVIKDIENDDVRITVGSMLYNYLESQTDQFDLRKKALSFKEFYLSEVINKKFYNRTIGYITIEKLIERKKITRMNQLRKADLDEIVRNFNKLETESLYNPNFFSSRVFGKESFIDKNEEDAFRRLNDDILKPIATYCKENYGSDYSNLKIVKVVDTVKPAREIYFYSKDVPTNSIVNDLRNGKILFTNKPTIIKLTRESYIHIII